MKIKDTDVEIRKVVGKASDGQPLVYIKTHGGLYMICKKEKDGGIKTISAAPHLAIMKWLAEKEDKDLTWTDGFNDEGEMQKSEGDRFMKLRSLVFSPALSTPLNNPHDAVLLYDVGNKTIEIIQKSELAPQHRSRCHIVRDLSFGDDFVVLGDEDV